MLSLLLVVALQATQAEAVLRRTLDAAAGQRAQAPDSTWREHDRAARAARERGDWQDARRHIAIVDSLLNGHPRVVAALARANAHLGDTVGVVRALSRMAQMGIAYDVAADSELAPVAGSPHVRALTDSLHGNLGARGEWTVVQVLPQRDFVAEGIAFDARRRRLLVSSIRKGTVVALTPTGPVSFADLIRDGSVTPLGLAVDSVRDRLWVSVSWSPVTDRLTRVDSGRSGVVTYDLASGRLVRRVELPRGAHELGDICLSRTGDLFVSDGRGSAVYVVRADADSLQTFIGAGSFVSPQGCAVDDGRNKLFVADYALGIASVDLTSRELKWVPKPPTAAVNGIDGLTLLGDALIGVQNGVDPNRVLAIYLDHAHGSIVAARVLAQDTSRVVEPTHVTRHGRDVYFIANGGFGMYDSRGVLRPDARQVAPRIGRITLERTAPP